MGKLCLAVKLLLFICFAHSFILPSGLQRRHPPILKGETDNVAKEPRTIKAPSELKGSKSSKLSGKKGRGRRGWNPNVALNRKITQAESYTELLRILQDSGNLSKKCSAGTLNSVNFSTSLHRLARHAVNSGYKESRAAILSDPRTALLLACAAESMAIDDTFSFRERSNVVWALSKLKVPPPKTVLPIEDTVDLEASASKVRELVLQAARSGSREPIWVPALSQLAGKILDYIGSRAMVYEGEFAMQEWTNMLWAWATSNRANEAVFGNGITQMMEHRSNLKVRPQEWSNSIWAFATAKVYNNHVCLLSAVADLIERDPEFLGSFKAQERSNTLWGVATLLSNKGSPLTAEEQKSAVTIARNMARKIVMDGADSFNSQELSNTLWSFATMGFGIGDSQDSANNYVVLENQEGSDKGLMLDCIHRIVDATIPKISRFKSQELNMVAWALARLLSDSKDTNVNAILTGIGKELVKPRRRVASQDIATTLWSFSTLKFYDKAIYRGLATRINEIDSRQLKPQEFSNTIWAFATAEYELPNRDVFDTTLVPSDNRLSCPQDPVLDCMSFAAKELMRRPHQFKPQEIKDILWSFSKLHVRHPVLFQFVAKHLVGSTNGDECRGLEDFSSQGLGNVAWAYARQGQLAVDVNGRFEQNKGNGRLLVYRTICYDVGHDLLHKLFAAIADRGIVVLETKEFGKPQDITSTAWSFATLSLKEADFMEAAKALLEVRCFRPSHGGQQRWNTKGQELANLLWALATLNVSPGSIMSGVTSYIQDICEGSGDSLSAADIARRFKRQELASIAFSCAVFDSFPPDLIQILYTGLLGAGEEQDPDYMSSVHADGGLQSEAIMTLLYVQAALDLKGECSERSLPKGFPEGWASSTPSQSVEEELTTDFSFKLSLTTSRMQKAVSDAFKRIGFEHVVEHTISMEDMAVYHGIRVDELAKEILSIDIANLDERIAIEVDGPSHFVHRIDKGTLSIVNSGLEYQFHWNGDQQEANGSTVLKQRLLRRLGWKVVNLPFWEWSELESDEAQDDYCRDALARIRDAS